MRTPPSPATYTPGSMVTTAPAGSGSAFVFESRGASCTSSPRPWPSEWPKASPRPRAAPDQKGVELDRLFRRALADDSFVFDAPELRIAVPAFERLAVKDGFKHRVMLRG